jgi:hypothetical protein
MLALAAAVTGTSTPPRAATAAWAPVSAHSGQSRAAAVTLLTESRAPAVGAAARHRHRHRAHTPRRIARAMMRHRFGWRARQFTYLNRLWNAESGWDRYATNPFSGAYGIPQAVPGSKMASAGPGWRWNARTQIRWGLRYIAGRYGTPHRAWLHQQETGWY